MHRGARIVRGLCAFPNKAGHFNFFALGYMDYVHRLNVHISLLSIHRVTCSSPLPFKVG